MDESVVAIKPVITSGAMSSATYTYTYLGTGYANPHAVSQIANGQSTTTYSYDQNGNLVQKTTDGLTTTYLWDYANRLIALGSVGATTTYGYDAFGSRVFQTTATSTTIYPFKWYSVASSTGSGAQYATTTEYVFNGDALLSTIDQQFATGVATGTPQTLYIHPDHLGSTNVVTNASGTVVQTLDYYPYGATRINSSTGGVNQKKKFASMERDNSTSLDYAKMRYYDNTRGQFLSEDPSFLAVGDPLKLLQVTGRAQNAFLSDPQLMNSYTWGRGNPITNKDPDGNFSIGFSYNANLEGGFGAYSAAYGSANINIVVDPATRQVWLVQSNTAAVNSGYMNNYQSAPDNGKVPFVLGLYGGRGVSASLSPKTTDPNDIQGMENSVNVNIPVLSFGAQGEETGKPTYSVSPGVKGIASVSQYPVYTQITKTYSVNQYVSNTASQIAGYYHAAIAGIQAQINAIQAKPR